MQVDLDNPQIDMASNLPSASTSTLEVEVIFEARCPKFSMEVDIDNSYIDLNSILISASTSTSEVKIFKQP